MTKRFATIACCALIAAVTSAGAKAQEQPAKQQPAQTQQQQVQHRNLWIAKFTCDAKAAAAVAATQHYDSDALQYSNLFDHTITFEKQDTQPQDTWSLTGKEIDFSGGSTAERALIGWGAGRSSITMEYTLTDPSGKVVWTQKIKTKPSWWGASGGFGAVQNQGAATDAQAQKLIEGLSKYFGVAPAKGK